MLVKEVIPKFTELNELCSQNSGGRVMFATDDFFAAAENMIADSEPVFVADRYTEFGKWMDGWETRRKRTAGHDWCIVKLATSGVIHGLKVDTAFFTGNYTPKYSVQAARLTPEEEATIPKRRSRMGAACNKWELDQMARLNTEKWTEIVPVTPLRPGYEDTRNNYQKVVSDETWTHIRLNMYPDGGVARLRVYGLARPDLRLAAAAAHLVDLAAMMNGATCQGYSNAHYGHPRNMIKPGRGANMGDGWETARRLDRPEVIRVNGDGTLKVPGEEWAVFRLARAGTVARLCVDTYHFKGNFPDSVRVEGARLDTAEWCPDRDRSWLTLLPSTKLTAHSEHWFECELSDIVTHIRVTMAPDGGISRIRVLGYIADEAHS